MPNTTAPTRRREIQKLSRQLAAIRQKEASIMNQRDALIRQELASGAGLREIGRDADLTHGAITKIRDKKI